MKGENRVCFQSKIGVFPRFPAGKPYISRTYPASFRMRVISGLYAGYLRVICGISIL
jgi:hypothetical protein